MSKYNKELVSKIRDEQKFREKQEKLKEKHGISEDVVVVEKDNMIKFLIRTVVKMIKLSATICLLLLATVGLFTLIYPSIRDPFFDVLRMLCGQYFSF